MLYSIGEEEPIGKGFFGVVFKRTYNGKVAAIKRIDFVSRINAFQELNMLKRECRHENIVDKDLVQLSTVPHI